MEHSAFAADPCLSLVIPLLLMLQAVMTALVINFNHGERNALCPEHVIVSFPGPDIVRSFTLLAWRQKPGTLTLAAGFGFSPGARQSLAVWVPSTAERSRGSPPAIHPYLHKRLICREKRISKASKNILLQHLCDYGSVRRGRERKAD